jgi:hypothetical protein
MEAVPQSGAYCVTIGFHSHLISWVDQLGHSRHLKSLRLSRHPSAQKQIIKPKYLLLKVVSMPDFTITGNIPNFQEPFFIFLAKAGKWLEEERQRVAGDGGVVMPFLDKEFGLSTVSVHGATVDYCYRSQGKEFRFKQDIQL